MKTQDFWYNLPDELIAQSPCFERDKCRMLVMDKVTGHLTDKHFFDIYDFLNTGDLLIANETKVFPARLIGKKRCGSATCEILLLTPLGDGIHWEAIVKPGRRLKPGSIIDFYDSKESCVLLSAYVCDWIESSTKGMRKIALKTHSSLSIDTCLHKIGKTPLPPYINDYRGDMRMYQTVYANSERSCAAPTAGLHFTESLIEKLKSKGVEFCTVDLEVGIDTFKPVVVDDIKDHKMHSETYTITSSVIDKIKYTKKIGRRVIAVGTTSVRTLESAWDDNRHTLIPKNRASTKLFITPGYKFRVVDALITNFHVPKSSLMMLVSAFGGYKNIMNEYKYAVDNKYRFLSFGDANFIY